MNTFQVGQRVVCIYPGPWTDPHGLVQGPAPKVNEVCVITYVELVGDWGVFIALQGMEDGRLFHADCFRPIVERKTDISVFKKLLAPRKTDELV